MKHKSKRKRMWEVINSLSLNNIKQLVSLPKLLTPLRKIMEAEEVCDYFNIFFSKMGKVLANGIPRKHHII